MMLAITKYELISIRKALLSATNREEGARENVSDGLRVINAVLSKNIEVVPVPLVDELLIDSKIVESYEEFFNLEEKIEDYEEDIHGC